MSLNGVYHVAHLLVRDRATDCSARIGGPKRPADEGRSLALSGTANGGIAGIRATLTHPYKGIPTGSTVTVAFAAASASDAVAAPAPPKRKPTHQHAAPPKKKGKPAPPAKRRVPPRVRLRLARQTRQQLGPVQRRP